MIVWLVRHTDLSEWYLNFLIGLVSVGRTNKSGGADHSLWPSVRDILAKLLWLDSEYAAPCTAI